MGIEYVECDTLSELVQFLKEYKGQSTKYKKKEIIVLTKQTPVMEKFCADNEIEAQIHAWKLVGPSFVVDGKCVITDELI